MQPNDIAAIGRMLYGERFTKPLSLALQVSDRTVRNWLSGKYAIPDGATDDLITLASCKQVERVMALVNDLGAMPSEFTFNVTDDDSKVRDGNLSAATHRLMVEATAALLREHGIPVRLINSSPPPR